jgi:hypothetical protein
MIIPMVVSVMVVYVRDYFIDNNYFIGPISYQKIILTINRKKYYIFIILNYYIVQYYLYQLMKSYTHTSPVIKTFGCFIILIHIRFY